MEGKEIGLADLQAEAKNIGELTIEMIKGQIPGLFGRDGEPEMGGVVHLVGEGEVDVVVGGCD